MATLAQSNAREDSLIDTVFAHWTQQLGAQWEPVAIGFWLRLGRCRPLPCR
jgi:hypothetical protein